LDYIETALTYLFVSHLTTPLSLNKLCTSPTLKMEAACSSESLVFVCQTIWHHISDDHKLHRNCSLLLMTLFSLMHDHSPTLREPCCIHLQDGGKIYETVWCHNPQDNKLHFHLCDISCITYGSTIKH